MISTVLCGRFYNIFVSPMLHKKSRLQGLLFSYHSLRNHRPISKDDFNLGGLIGLERIPDMVAVLGQFLAVHKDAAAFPAVAKRQGLALVGGDGGTDALLVPVHMIQLGEGI